MPFNLANVSIKYRKNVLFLDYFISKILKNFNLPDMVFYTNLEIINSQNLNDHKFIHSELTNLKRHNIDNIVDQRLMELDDHLETTKTYIDYAEEIMSDTPSFKKIIRLCKQVESNDHLKDKPLHLEVRRILSILTEHMDGILEQFEMFEKKYE